MGGGGPGSFDPATEDSAGDDEARGDIQRASRAVGILVRAAYVPPELTNGAMVWRHRPLTPMQQRQVDRGLATCQSY